MSSDLITRRTALLGVLALGGCGFAPVYRDDAGFRGKITYLTDDTPAGFRLREQLERRLGVADAPQYELEVVQSRLSRRAAIASGGDTVRFNVLGSAKWVLRENGASEVLSSGEVEGFTSYTTTASTVATQAAQADAGARLSVDLANKIVTGLLARASEPAQ